MAAGTGSDGPHPSSLARRLQQHGAKCKSRSRHHALLIRVEKARPMFFKVRRAILPSQQPSFSFLVLVSISSCCALCFPQAGQLPVWTQDLLWTVVQWEHLSRGETADSRTELSVGELHAPSPTGEDQRGLVEDWKLMMAGDGDASHQIRVNSVYNKS